MESQEIPRPGTSKEDVLDWLQAMLTLTDWPPSRLAREAGLAPSTINKALAGAGHVLSTTSIGRIETAVSKRIRERVAAGDLDWRQEAHPKERLVYIMQTDARDRTGEKTVDSWGFPENWLRMQCGVDDPTRHRVVAIEDDAMWPDYRTGDRALVDTSLQEASPSGVYMLFDGVQWVPRHLELLPGIEPPTVMIRARSPDHMSREARLSDLRVMGRVVGMWRRV